MVRFITFLLVYSMCSSASMSFGQVTQFPYNEGFDNEVFVQGKDVYFIENWFGNLVDGMRIFQEKTNVNNGTAALGLWPVVEEGEEEAEIVVIAEVDLDLSGLENVVTKFWLATVATGDMKHVKLYLRLSTDGGTTFGPKLIMSSDPRGFENIDMPYQEFTYALHPNAYMNKDVVVRFMAKAGAKKGSPAKILLDDIYFFAAPEDIYPPMAFEPTIVNENKINIRFSEPVSPHTALNINNYTFLSGSVIPVVTEAVLTEPDLVSLSLSPGISIGKYHDLEIANIEDPAGNLMVTKVSELIYNPLTEGLVITEIMYDEPPVGQKDDLEFIELKNITVDTIQLGGLRIKGAIASGRLPEFSLAPGAHWLTAKDADLFTSFFGVSATEWHGGNLSNDDPEMIYIQNTDHHSGVVIDSLTYRIGTPWPQGAAGQGYSMELIDPLSENSNPENWRDAENFCGQYKGHDIYASPGADAVILGIGEESFVGSLGFYPNPVHNKLYLVTPYSLTKVEIYSILGVKICSFTDGDKIIDTSNLSEGLYLVKLYRDYESATIRIVKYQ